MTITHVSGKTKGGQVRTLDTEHLERARLYDCMQCQLPVLKKRLAEWRARIAEVQRHGRSSLTDSELRDLLDLVDAAKATEQEIKKIESRVDEVDYYTNTGAILFKYYDIIENGASTLETSPSQTDQHESNTILKWFNSPASKVSSSTNDRATLLERYLVSSDPTFRRIPAATPESSFVQAVCQHCKSSDRTTMMHEGYMFCNKCFTVEYLLVDHDKPSYKDPPKEITYFAYKRINHFNEWLNTVQGKETTLIPDDMFDKILFELKKMRVTNLGSLSHGQMKEILKKLRPEGGSRYYEHIPHIITRLNGLPTPHLPNDLEERLRHMFCQIQVPFLKHSCALNPARKNFLSYSYVLNKFMQLLEKDQYLSFFPLLKSREKLHQQDLIWKNICEELGWQYYRSI